MSNLPDPPTVSATATAVNPETIRIAPGGRTLDGTRHGLLMRDKATVGEWTIWPGGPVTVTIHRRHYRSVGVDTVRGLLRRYGYEVAS